MMTKGNQIFSTYLTRRSSKLNRIWPLVVLILLNISYSVEVYASDKETNCRSNEDVYFSCAAGKKIISFCSATSSKDSSYLSYRFSLNHKTTFEFVSNSINSGKIMSADVPGSSNAGIALWFTNDNFTYALMSPIKGKPFLEIVKNGKSLSRFICQKDVVDNTDDKLDLVEPSDSSTYFRLFNRSKMHN